MEKMNGSGGKEYQPMRDQPMKNYRSYAKILTGKGTQQPKKGNELMGLQKIWVATKGADMEGEEIQSEESRLGVARKRMEEELSVGGLSLKSEDVPKSQYFFDEVKDESRDLDWVKESILGSNSHGFECEREGLTEPSEEEDDDMAYNHWQVGGQKEGFFTLNGNKEEKSANSLANGEWGTIDKQKEKSVQEEFNEAIGDCVKSSQVGESTQQMQSKEQEAESTEEKAEVEPAKEKAEAEPAKEKAEAEPAKQKADAEE
ncbi:hypothetical protein SLEP1_g560 [Rubroshorea leprosula]|uniref:Uncharacterized protein n=1 Tax=Rubroshorea leprosula TaxID=152421 RepID=A0AAV5HHW4_9ROSI|nr:hypothetical protein SLEP1_g560 [Rubroshorea leprosula]